MASISSLFGILVMVGIIFGTFNNFACGIPLGWEWFVQMLWFVIGFPVLVVISTLIFSLGIKGEEQIEKE